MGGVGSRIASAAVAHAGFALGAVALGPSFAVGHAIWNRCAACTIGAFLDDQLGHHESMLLGR